MKRPTALGLLLLAACTPQADAPGTYARPDMKLSASDLDFGAVALGASETRTVSVSNIGGMPLGIGTAAASDIAFSVAWSGPQCAAEPELPGVDDGVTQFVVDAGCTVTLSVTYTPTTTGPAVGALVIESVGDDPGAGQRPPYLRDPSHWKQVVWLSGAGSREVGVLRVRPQTWDFGSVVPGEGDPPGRATIQIENEGAAPVTLGDDVLDCDGPFILDENLAGLVLDAGGRAELGVTFAPTTVEPTTCTLAITSDDAANRSVDVLLRGNTRARADNTPPTLAIRAPESGERHDAYRDLAVELNVFDVDQPANTLDCSVQSAVRGRTLVDCTPVELSGHVEVAIPAAALAEGSDTLLVTVTDAAGRATTAAVAIVVGEAYPPDDDDGDGWGGLSGDCDDADPARYPDADELPNGADDNCDGAVDEGTELGDDDGDGWSERDGDCDDDADDIAPDAAELPNDLDDDCDTIVDEATLWGDDDGDGASDVGGDCDETDAAVGPDAVEMCGDGVDNDCDHRIDDEDVCTAASGPATPVAGVLRPSVNACEAGDEVVLEAWVVDPDGDPFTRVWRADGADFGADQAAVSWPCPEPTGPSPQVVPIELLVTSSDGTTTQAGEFLYVWPVGGIARTWSEPELVLD
jgi:hypothetical protein